MAACSIWIAVFAAYLVVPIKGQTSAGCPTDAFVSRDGSDYCYLFSNAAGTTDWFSANSQCSQQYKDSTLASVVDDAENTFIFDSMSTSGASNYWIGLYKISGGGGSGSLMWIDGTTYNYDNFESGQPDNVTGSGSDCVSMNRASNGQWSDDACTSSRSYVCKTRKVDSQTGSCPDGWTINGVSCYYVNIDAQSSWTAAQQACQDMGGSSAYLVSIYSEPENTFVFNLMNNAGDGTKTIWLGMNRCSASDLDDDWFWYDETPFADYSNWDDLQPDGDGGCAAANLAGGFSRWEEISCTDKVGVFCKAPKVSTACDVSFIERNGYCYYVNPTLQLSRDDALEWCSRHLSATLGSLVDADEASYVNDIALSTGSAAHSYWIGLFKNVNDAAWSWRDGSSKAIVKWADGEPSNDGSSELCATTGLATGEWFSSTCEQSFPYVCKAVPGDGACIGSFESYNGACYLFVGDTTQTQSSAFTQCKNAWQLSSLVSLTSSEEHSYVWQRMVNVTTIPLATDFWIGYQRCDPGDQIYSWTWLDSGRTINQGDYQNFVLPVNQQNCAIMNENSNWTDSNCNLGEGFGCKVSALSPETTTTVRPSTTTNRPPSTTSQGQQTTTTRGNNNPTTTNDGATTTTADEGSSQGGGLSSGDVVGIVFGVLIALALLAAVGIFGYIYVLKPRMANGGTSSGKDTTAFAFSNTTYSEGQEDV